VIIQYSSIESGFPQADSSPRGPITEIIIIIIVFEDLHIMKLFLEQALILHISY
jgi:hypothetical protein